SNLMEAGESATTYEGLDVNPAPSAGQRGYYYTWLQAKPTGDDDICKKHLNRYYRIPTDADWALLIAGYASMTDEEKAAWKGISSMAGYRHGGGTWLNWNYNGKWWSSTATDKSNSIDNAGTWATPTTTAGFWLSVRCVRNI
ncbi:MAG: fibrobacter succinogenes major paralogous domain-containing protein, partial [Candidatus Symbiothrix sp.]|nr:fibrobacter succinogenes major paralogous domain-containing protein [Candidatus Symbiothrix sp.]